MGNLFKPKMPTPQAPTPIPQADDEAVRRAQLRQYAKLSSSSGRDSTMMSEKNLGDVAPPQVRSGVLTAGE